MNINRNNNNKIEKILNSLDSNQRASAPDFFYTRLKARMENAHESKTRKTWTLRPAYALAALAFLFVLNGFLLLQGQEKNENTENTAIADTETAQSVAAEYSLNDNNLIYELNPEK